MINSLLTFNIIFYGIFTINLHASNFQELTDTEFMEKIKQQQKDQTLYTKNDKNQTLLHQAITLQNEPAITEILKLEVNLNQQDIDGHSCLHLAVLNPNLSIIETLISHPLTDPTLKNKCGLKAYSLAWQLLQKTPTLLHAKITNQLAAHLIKYRIQNPKSLQPYQSSEFYTVSPSSKKRKNYSKRLTFF